MLKFTLFSALLLLLLMGFFLWRKHQKFYFSIRWKFLLLVVFSAGIPFFMLAFTVREYLDKARLHELEVGRQESVNRLQAFDEEFLALKGKIQMELLDLMTKKDFPPAIDPLALKRASRGFLRRFDVFSFSLIAGTGKTLELFSRESGRPDWSGALNELSRRVFERFSGEQGGSPGTDWEAVYGNDLAGSLKGILEEANANLGKLFEIRIGETGFFVLMAPGLARPGLARSESSPCLFTFVWRKKDLVRAYLRQTASAKPIAEGEEFLILSREDSQRLKSAGDLEQEPQVYLSPALRKTRAVILPQSFPAFQKKLVQANSLYHDIILYRNVPYLITGMPARRLDSYYLVHLKPMESQFSELDRLGWRYLFFATINIFFVLGFGHFLAKRILRPIKELSEGLSAVRVKRFHFRIPPQEADELGDLTILFNTMMESHHQMAMARQVQRELFPKTVLEVGHYRIFGLSWPATDLGGDYLDYLPVGNKSFIALIADVTGHGVPAALVMAMSKAMINHLSRANAFPLQILESLNQVLFETVKKTRLLSLGFLWVNTETDEATFFNCGHLYPAIRHLNGELSFVQSNGVVLGRLARVKTSPITFSLLPGERLVFYTDGLIESFINAGSAEPHEDFKEYLKKRPPLPIEQACQDLLDHLPTVLAGETQPDDFSVVMVDRIK